jgi:hypothetical protein
VQLAGVAGALTAPIARYVRGTSFELRGLWTSDYRTLPTRSFHFGRFTPFTMSHRQSDDSPIKASTRTGRIVPAYAGARMSVKLFVR